MSLIFTEISDAVLIMTFIACIPVTTYITAHETKKRKVNCTIKEMQDSFLILIDNAFDLETEIAKLRRDVKTQKSTLQPCLIALGQNLFDSQHFYTFCDGILYKFNSIIAALDICFKLFFVLNLEYPCKSHNVWTFFEKNIFELKTNNINLLPKMHEFTQDFQNNYYKS